MLNKHYEAKLEAQLAEWSDQIESLRDRAAAAVPAERPAIDREIDELEEKRKIAARELEELRQTCAVDSEEEGVLARVECDGPADSPFY